MDKIAHSDVSLYSLSTGIPIYSLTSFPSPLDEYHAAFEGQTCPFLEYFSVQGGKIEKQTLTRGQFWERACSAAAYLSNEGLSRGDRVLHCFSSNSIYDLVFRLASIMLGYVAVTINWQADSDETIVYKAKTSNAKLVLYDEGFTGRMERIKSQLPPMAFVAANIVERCQATNQLTYAQINYEDERMIIFTSGTTGKPKGVSLSHRSYLANRLTFDQYFGMTEDTPLDLLLANPLHHTNSSALSDWAMRRPGAIIHLLSRYTTTYWKILVEVADQKRNLLVAPMVSRHIDFLESLSAESELPVEETRLKKALSETHILIGSAPVGPTTIKRILNYSGHLPHVRFGSTETCLQVMATPATMSQNELMRAFEVGWSHRYKGEETIGYYIGREHFPFTRTKVVKAIDPHTRDYFRPCEMGEPGYLVTQGPNIMSYYVGDPEATKAVFKEGWYVGLRDIVFTLKNKDDGQLDYYWMSRDSALLIRGGANYAYDQIAAELTKFIVEHFQLKPEQFQLAVVGLRLESEHEDSCCVTIELNDEGATAEQDLKYNFIQKASSVVSKGARPDYVQIGRIPRSFKGEILYPQLKLDFLHALERKRLAND